MTNNQPLVSVIIPCYNCKDYIRETVESVLRQTYKNFEIILIDDGSTDGLFEACEDFFHVNNVMYIHKENGGPASARNLGIAKSNGEFIAFLDSDDLWSPNKLEKQTAALVAGDCKLAYTKRAEFLSEKGTGEHIMPNAACYSGDVFERLLLGNFITNSSVMIKREVLNDVGLFREDNDFFAIEDYQLWLRIAAKYNLCFIDELLIFYRLHQNQISKSSVKTLFKLSKMYFDFFKSGELVRARTAILYLAIKYYLNFLRCARAERKANCKI
jgi:glycosyltransferase involved in cell wall biosynthesis